MNAQKTVKRPIKTEWWDASMVICLERGADLHMAQLMPLASVKSRLVLPFWYRLTWVVPDKGLITTNTNSHPMTACFAVVHTVHNTAIQMQAKISKDHTV